MEKHGRVLPAIAWLVGVAFCALACGCGEDETGPGEDTYDVDKDGIPRFVSVDYIELSRVRSISKFRSSEGHDYSDDFEKCRSMKHYFWPSGGDPGSPHWPSWDTIGIRSPVTGTVSEVFDEWAGTQVRIKSSEHPAFYFIVFHVALASPLKVGDTVAAGQLLGHHVGDQTMSDIAVGVNTPRGWKLVSYFDVLADSVFDDYQARGVGSRADVVISKQERDADPLTCDGMTFIDRGHLEDWFVLN